MVRSRHLIVKLLMAQLDTAEASSARKRPGVSRMKKTAPRIDMTPMVDLGFLLISFFVITTELSRPGGMTLIVPKDSKNNLTELGDSYALTILLTGGKQYYYEGDWKNAVQENRIQETSLTGLREVISRKQKILDDTIRYKEGRKGLMLLIKATENASYTSVVDALDEVVINAVEKHAIIAVSEEEKNWLRQRE